MELARSAEHDGPRRQGARWLTAGLSLLALLPAGLWAAPVPRPGAAVGGAIVWRPGAGARLQVRLRAGRQVGHVPGGMGAYGSGMQLSLRQLSWASVAGGLALAGIGRAADDASYVAMGAMLAPLGLWGVYRTRDDFTYVTGEYLGEEYGVRHYAEDMRYIWENHPSRQDIARALLRRHPDLHPEFLWSLEAFRDPATETEGDRAFLAWYRELVEP